MTAFELPADDAPAEEWGRLAVSIPDWRNPRLPPDCDVPALWDAASGQPVPDPDHWAWEGWLLRMLGPNARPFRRPGGLWVVTAGQPKTPDTMVPHMFGRACIATAAALGRWPGGGA